MIQGVMFDLRDEEIQTHKQMDDIMFDRLEGCRAEFKHFEPVAVILHESQVKWLKLELYMHGKYTSKQLKELGIQSWQEVPVIVTDEWDAVPCPSCGKFHDDEQAWYDER